MILKSSLTKEYYKTGEVASFLNVTPRTVQLYCQQGFMAEKIVNNRRYIPRDSVVHYLREKGLLIEDAPIRSDVIYARVSTHKQKERGDLNRQIQRIEQYVAHQEPRRLEIITDIGSGLNDQRKGLFCLLERVAKDEVGRIFISYKDRLTRFGFAYLEFFCRSHQTEIVVVSSEEEDKTLSEELAEDIITIIHSFSGKLYGLRKRVRDHVTKELSDDDSNRKYSHSTK